MQSSGIPAKFNIPWGNAAVAPYIRAIPQASQIGIQAGAASLTDGFPPLTFTPVGAGGADPWGADFNGIFNQNTAWLRWLHAGGPINYDATWAASAANGYPKGAILQSTVVPGKMWLSTAENNTNNPDTGGANWTDVAPPLPRGYIDGAILSNDAGSPTTAIDISAGALRDDSNTWNINQTTFIKTTGPFVAGSSNGGLDTGSIGNGTWYAVYAILNPLTGATDNLISASFSSPTMPSGFTKKRYLGAIKTDGSAHPLAFTQVGDDFLWTTPIAEITNSNPGNTNQQTITLAGVPTGQKLWWKWQAAVTSNTNIYISSPDAANQQASTTTNPASTLSLGTTTTFSGNGITRTNTSAQINYRMAVNANWTLVTIGWVDQRGKNA
jgi:hypothetical protein